MPKFSKRSKKRLLECDPKLRKIMNEAIKHYDFSILCGHRGKQAQNKAYYSGFSTLMFPKSRHNKKPSLAVDIAPYPIDWSNSARFYTLAGVVKLVAKQLKIRYSWGGNWKNFKDLPHYQVKQGE